MSNVESCEGCGFTWDAVRPDDVVPRLTAAVSAFVIVLGADPDLVAARPQTQRWSVLEYGAHVRDVLLNIRDRIFVALAEDEPVTKPMYRDVRIPFYAGESGERTAQELEVAAALFGRTFAGLTSEQLGRPLVVSYPRETSRAIAWMASQALHEVEHHLGDAHEDLAAFGEPPAGATPVDR